MSKDDSDVGMTSPEFRRPSVPKTKFTYIRGASPRFGPKRVEYMVIDGMALFEGDIALGKADEMEKIRSASDIPQRIHALSDVPARAVAITGERYRWPNRLMPYTIDPGLPNQARVTDAIQNIQNGTRACLSFIERTNANAAQYPNFVRLFRENGCWSYVGMQGGQQDISLADGCGLGSTIHEILHAWGLWHEQSREDRDNFVQISWQNIMAGYASNFDQHITDGDDIGTYDYCSIMHYPRTAFSVNGQDTITPLQPTGNCVLGQRNDMSPGDIAALRAIYSCVDLSGVSW